MNPLYRPSFAEQSARVAFNTFFALIKAVLIIGVLLVGGLIVGQSTLAPISVRLLTVYAREYAVARAKPYRGYFPQPYILNFNTK